MEFPERIYTGEEVKKAGELVKKGYKHRLRIVGDSDFERKVEQALEQVRTAGYHDFLRTYVRSIIEIDGVTQLREADAAIWTNKYAVENPVDAASLFVQKANHMKEYLEGKEYYGGQAEKRSVEKRIQFLEVLERESKDIAIKNECKRLLQMWEEASLAY